MIRHRQNLFLAAATILALGTASMAPAEALTFKFTPTPFEDFPPGENLASLRGMLGLPYNSMPDEYLLSILRNQLGGLGLGQVSVDDTIDSLAETNPVSFGTIAGGSITSPVYRSLSPVFVSRYSSNSYSPYGSSIWRFTTVTPFASLRFSCNSNLINCSGSKGWYFHKGLAGALIYYGPIVVSDFSWGKPPANPSITPAPTQTPTPVSSIPEPSSVFGLLLLGGAWLWRRKWKQTFPTGISESLN